ncbi:hypothetical protein RB195_005565 [Necator americanus]|uniref:Uncharacterized protein n=1 Tax=Necator americanus TaxID=51031 RepID=A0ABR1BSB8_NECAM
MVILGSKRPEARCSCVRSSGRSSKLAVVIEVGHPISPFISAVPVSKLQVVRTLLDHQHVGVCNVDDLLLLSSTGVNEVVIATSSVESNIPGEYHSFAKPPR